MTSEWIYDEKSLEAPKVYDKDFKRLNKIATAKKVTTCIDQYKLRKHLDSSIRIKAPGESSMRKTFADITPRQAENGYGRPNRPSTPMKAVMSGHFEAVAAVEQEWKNHMNENVF